MTPLTPPEDAVAAIAAITLATQLLRLAKIWSPPEPEREPRR